MENHVYAQTMGDYTLGKGQRYVKNHMSEETWDNKELFTNLSLILPLKTAMIANVITMVSIAIIVCIAVAIDALHG